MKRKLTDVAREYAHELRLQPKTAKLKGDRVVEVLTRQHGSRFPVALNLGTRPAVCGVLKKVLGEKEYEERCISGKTVPMALPELPSAPPQHVAATPTLDEIRARFPADAAALLQEGGQAVWLLNPDEVATVTHALSAPGLTTRPTPLDVVQGNGAHGSYATLVAPLPALLQRVQEAARQWILEHAGPLKPVKKLDEKGKYTTLAGATALGGTKSLLLRYGLGGINYAHHDSCGDFQALLMLSQPGIDYKGGAFYLGEAEPPFATKAFPFAHAGELLIFRGRQGHGDRAYLHGMQQVLAGSAAETRRFAVGFFQ